MTKSIVITHTPTAEEVLMGCACCLLWSLCPRGHCLSLYISSPMGECSSSFQIYFSVPGLSLSSLHHFLSRSSSISLWRSLSWTWLSPENSNCGFHRMAKSVLWPHWSHLKSIKQISIHRLGKIYVPLFGLVASIAPSLWTYLWWTEELEKWASGQTVQILVL